MRCVVNTVAQLNYPVDIQYDYNCINFADFTLTALCIARVKPSDPTDTQVEVCRLNRVWTKNVYVGMQRLKISIQMTTKWFGTVCCCLIPFQREHDKTRMTRQHTPSFPVRLSMLIIFKHKTFIYIISFAFHLTSAVHTNYTVVLFVMLCVCVCQTNPCVPRMRYDTQVPYWLHIRLLRFRWIFHLRLFT